MLKIVRFMMCLGSSGLVIGCAAKIDESANGEQTPSKQSSRNQSQSRSIYNREALSEPPQSAPVQATSAPREMTWQRYMSVGTDPQPQTYLPLRSSRVECRLANPVSYRTFMYRCFASTFKPERSAELNVGIYEGDGRTTKIIYPTTEFQELYRFETKSQLSGFTLQDRQFDAVTYDVWVTGYPGEFAEQTVRMFTVSTVRDIDLRDIYVPTKRIGIRIASDGRENILPFVGVTLKNEQGRDVALAFDMVEGIETKTYVARSSPNMKIEIRCQIAQPVEIEVYALP